MGPTFPQHVLNQHKFVANDAVAGVGIRRCSLASDPVALVKLMSTTCEQAIKDGE
jgi:hypothetical protein